MASEKRITVNFSYPDLHELIVSQAKKTGSSSSAVIQDMLFDALKYRMENNALLPSGKLVANKNLVPEKVFNAGFEINNLTIDGKIRGATNEFHRLFQKGHVRVTLPFIHFCGVLKPADTINKRDILDMLILSLKERYSFSDLGDFAPTLFLLFIGKVEVKYKGHNDKGLEIEISYSCKSIPVRVKNSNNDGVLLFDLANIKYKAFYDVARNGWNRKKYSHQLFINGVEGMRGGGFFVGVLYEPQLPEELVMPLKDDFISSSNMRYRFINHPSTVKVIKSTFPHSVTMNPDGSFTVKEKTSHDVGLIKRFARQSGIGV